jgi:F0F1-type ATP synthase membrane subunit b/b'
VFQELRSQIGEISVELAARIVGQSLDESAHQRLIDEYIDEVAGSGNGQG